VSQFPVTSSYKSSYINFINFRTNLQQKSFGCPSFSAFKNRPDNSVNWICRFYCLKGRKEGVT
jgi:hypothetical protein